jgi:hypothetical protein
MKMHLISHLELQSAQFVAILLIPNVIVVVTSIALEYGWVMKVASNSIILRALEYLIAR